jgi:hypothetical protein
MERKMTGYEFTYRVGKSRRIITIRSFGWTPEDATARMQRGLSETYTKPVVILSTTEVGYDTVLHNLPTPSALDTTPQDVAA